MSQLRKLIRFNIKVTTTLPHHIIYIFNLCIMKNSAIKILTLLLMFIVPISANANLIWPSIYIAEQYYTWPVIVIGLLIEVFAVKFFLKASWGKSALMAVTMNLISALLGLCLIPISGIVVEILTAPFGGGTFHLSHWILDYIAALLCNVVIEGLALKWIFKYPFRRNFWWLLGANAISVIICLIGF